MQQTNVLIVGRGLCGAWLGQFLTEQGISCIVIDEAATNTASIIASGIINPISGFRFAPTWLGQEAIPFAVAQYQKVLPSCIQPIEHIHFIQNQTELQYFNKKLAANSNLLHAYTGAENLFNHNLPMASIANTWLVDVPAFLEKAKANLKNACIAEKLNTGELHVSEKRIVYKNIEAQKIVFCEGAAAVENKFWKHVPIVPVKGEALIVSIPALTNKKIYKGKYSLVPWQNNLYWVGSSFNRSFVDAAPSQAFYNEVQQWLNGFLNTPYTIVQHVAAIRPTIMDRTPLAQWHPQFKNVGILNGMGTKAVMLAPYFAERFVVGCV
jgi:glycine/D-amino acid oxidase-like deaminating enzyme